MEAPTKTSFLQSELHKIPVVQKLKQNRGSSQLKKLTDSIQQLSMNQGQVIDNQLNQIYLLLLIKGEVELWWGGRSQLESKRLSAYGYQLVDKNLIKIEIKSDSWLCFLREKDLVQIFWGIINLPFINVRMCQLQRTQIFSHFEKRSLMKIAFDLQELSLKIGSTLILGEIHGGQAKRYCFYIISGQVKIIKQGKAVCMLGPNEIFGLDCLLSRAQIVQGQTRKGVVGKITTECAYLYKISVQSLSENQQNAIDCATKSSKWRETRFRKMVKIEESEKLMKRKLAKQRASFIDKQLILRSFYGGKVEDLIKLKRACTPSDRKCQSREQFYAHKLDQLKRVQKKRYDRSQTIALFPVSPPKASLLLKSKPLFQLSAFKEKQPKRTKTELGRQSISTLEKRGHFFHTNI